jgi:hypothetical protein
MPKPFDDFGLSIGVHKNSKAATATSPTARSGTLEIDRWHLNGGFGN